MQELYLCEGIEVWTACLSCTLDVLYLTGTVETKMIAAKVLAALRLKFFL